MDPYVEMIWTQPNIKYSEEVDGCLRRTKAGMLALQLELNYYLRSLRPNKGKKMNDTPNTHTDMDSAKIAVLMAELHADANPGVASDGEATQPEGAFVSEDDAAHPVATN